MFVLDAQRWRRAISLRWQLARVLAMHRQQCLQRGSAASVHVVSAFGRGWMPEIIGAVGACLGDRSSRLRMCRARLQYVQQLADIPLLAAVRHTRQQSSRRRRLSRVVYSITGAPQGTRNILHCYPNRYAGCAHRCGHIDAQAAISPPLRKSLPPRRAHAYLTRVVTPSPRRKSKAL